MSIFIRDEDAKLENIEKYTHLVLAEQSISDYIIMLENESGEILPEEDKEWLYRKEREIFDTYYINQRLSITVASDKDDEKLKEYLGFLEDRISKMYAHILMSEFKCYLLTKTVGL